MRRILPLACAVWLLAFFAAVPRAAQPQSPPPSNPHPESLFTPSENCVACHNAQRLGPLNWPMDHVLIGSYLKAGKMPAGHRLQVLQRRELFAKLIEEYFAIDAAQPGILKAWLISPPLVSHGS